MPTTVIVMLVSLCLLDFTSLAFYLAKHREPHPQTLRASRIFVALLCWVLLSVARAPLLGFFSFTMFGVIYLAYLGLIIVVPLVSASLLLRHRMGLLLASRWVKVGLWLGLFAPLLLAVYASWFELKNVQLERASFTLRDKRVGALPLKIGVLSDIQTSFISEHERGAVQRLMSEQPDIILIAGDLFQGSAEELTASLDDFHTLLNTLKAPGGIYFVQGDAERESWTERLLVGTSVQYLYNETRRIKIKDRELTLLGLALAYSSSEAERAMRSLQIDPDEDIRILLSHRPDSILSLPEGSRVDLVVAGHTHGGQIQLPFIGPLLTLTNVPRAVAAGGAAEVNQNSIYVSRGLGRERGQAPPIRFLCPPEVAILTLE
jgi:uncharacterized protein